MSWSGNQGAHDGLGWAGVKSGGGGAGYHYGWPAGGTSEPNVVAQWIFDEASGNIVDEVTGITLAAVGSPTFTQTVTGLYAGISPGIAYPASTQHSNATPDASTYPGTGDFTIEWWASTTTATNGYTFAWIAAVGAKGVYNNTNFLTGVAAIAVRSTDSTVVAKNFTMTAGYADGNPHKFRLVCTRAANMELFQDGVSLGTQALTTLIGKTIEFEGMTLGGFTGSPTFEMDGTLYEWRLSLNATNNSGGPGGG